MLYTRLFPNDPAVRFEGAVHEQIEKSLIKNGYRILRSGIEIIHIGYSTSKDVLKLKAERNLKILLMEYLSAKESYTAFHIGQSYAMLGNKEEAVKYFQYALEDKNLKNEYRALAFRYIAIENAEKLNWSEALKNITMSLKSDSNQPLALLAAGKIYAKTGHLKDSEQCCLKAYEVNSQLVKGTHYSYQTIYLDQKDLLYHCMSIALSISNRDLFNRFFEIFKGEYKNENVPEFELFEVLLNKKDVNADSREKYLDSLNVNNIELITALLESYPDNQLKLDLLKALSERLPGNSSVLNKLGLCFVSQNKFREAEEYFLKSYEQNAYDPSTVFYLVSVFLQNNKAGQIPVLISSAEDTFRDIPEVASRLHILKQKLNIS
jgi:tetratricopeptide (TPR) repeat protein